MRLRLGQEPERTETRCEERDIEPIQFLIVQSERVEGYAMEEQRKGGWKWQVSSASSTFRLRRRWPILSRQSH